jgi:hypothetical protein
MTQMAQMPSPWVEADDALRRKGMTRAIATKNTESTKCTKGTKSNKPVIHSDDGDKARMLPAWPAFDGFWLGRKFPGGTAAAPPRRRGGGDPGWSPCCALDDPITVNHRLSPAKCRSAFHPNPGAGPLGLGSFVRFVANSFLFSIRPSGQMNPGRTRLAQWTQRETTPHFRPATCPFNLCESVKYVDSTPYLRHLRHLRLNVFPAESGRHPGWMRDRP